MKDVFAGDIAAGCLADEGGKPFAQFAAEARLALANKRIVELEAALRPFADYASFAMAKLPNYYVITSGRNMPLRHITVGDIKRACAVLVLDPNNVVK